MVRPRTKKVHFTWRVELAGGGEGPFQASGLCYRPRYANGSKTKRPGPGTVRELASALYSHAQPRFGAYSLPNLRHWFPRTEVRWLEKNHPGQFVVALYRARDAIIAGNQVVFERERAERLAEFPLSQLYLEGGRKSGREVPLPGPGILEPALAACKGAAMGGTIYRDGRVIGYVRRTASAGGWSSYFNERGQS